MAVVTERRPGTVAQLPADAPIEAVDCSVYRVPTEEPEADGTLTWDETTVPVVQVRAGGETGLGFTYGPRACQTLVSDVLAAVVVGRPAADPPGAWRAMVDAVRNAGRPGISSMAIAAVDVALWDLAARLSGRPLFRLLGAVRPDVPVYGSGGFTSLGDRQLEDQLGGWVEAGIPRVKMKIGTSWGSRAERDIERVALVRHRIGRAELYVDANGAYTRKEAVRVAAELAHHDVRWFEEPVSSDDLAGLREVRGLTDIDVAAGEYGYDLAYFERLCAAEAVDVLQVDVSRCGGITEWRRAAAVAAAHGLQVSGHCAPALHAHVAPTVPNLRHVEYFADHVRVDRILFDGVLEPREGALWPDPSVPGTGLSLSADRAAPHRVG